MMDDGDELQGVARGEDVPVPRLGSAGVSRWDGPPAWAGGHTIEEPAEDESAEDEADYVRVKRPSRLRRRVQWLRDEMRAAAPRDDDGPDDLPVFLRGTKGRILLALVTGVILAGWLWVVVSVVT